MSSAELQQALASFDEQEARRLIREHGGRLREGGAEGEDDLVAELCALASHRSATVRRAVADVCDGLPHPAFEATHPRLLDDGDPFVRRAAEAAGHRHARARLRQVKVKAEDEALEELLAEIERKGGRNVRRLAERAIDRGVERFARGVSHEVNKTKDALELALLKLGGAVERPDRGAVAMREHVALVRQRSAFVYAIVGRAREYAERNKATFADLALIDVVNEATAELLDRSAFRDSSVAVTMEVDESLRLDLDRQAMKQALQNVLQNAVESYPAAAERRGVRVSAEARRSGTEVVLYVADHGVGIAEEDVPSMFVPFASRKPGGTGVGMLIVRRMIEEIHGGKLEIASAPGKGTTVAMVLPARQRRP